MMRQLKFYKYAAGGLLLLNIAMLAFFFLTKPGPGHEPFPPGGDGMRAIDIMKMDEQQDQAFLQYAQEHIQLMDGFDNQQRNLLKPYFNTLIDSTGNINSDSLLTQILQLERNKIESTYQHFQDVKSILRPEQQENFEAFIDHAVGRILLEQNKQPPAKDI